MIKIPECFRSVLPAASGVPAGGVEERVHKGDSLVWLDTCPHGHAHQVTLLCALPRNILNLLIDGFHFSLVGIAFGLYVGESCSN
jgi:hypothetical protein